MIYWEWKFDELVNQVFCRVCSNQSLNLTAEGEVLTLGVQENDSVLAVHCQC